MQLGSVYECKTLIWDFPMDESSFCNHFNDVQLHFTVMQWELFTCIYIHRKKGVQLLIDIVKSVILIRYCHLFTIMHSTACRNSGVSKTYKSMKLLYAYMALCYYSQAQVRH